MSALAANAIVMTNFAFNADGTYSDGTTKVFSTGRTCGAPTDTEVDILLSDGTDEEIRPRRVERLRKGGE